MKRLQVGPKFSFPLELATGSTGILATRGAGKSNAAVVMAEEMFKAGIPFVVVDPKGDWYGIRAAGDGGPGLPIPVFGGRHGDIPLESSAGSLVAELVLEHRLTCVLDVSQFDKAETTRFLLAFAKHLFAHADDDGAEPLHLFLEEAHEYLPQVVKGDQAHLVSWWQRIVKQGRFKGLGVTMISQRSSVLNKDVLELIDTLIVLRTIGPLSRKTIAEWVKDQDVDPKLMASLPSLKDGEAWVWSPGALGILERMQFRRRNTFDSGVTPKVGEKRRQPGTLADIDLGDIKEAMAETIEKAKSEDPHYLRQQITKLKNELKASELAHEATRAAAAIQPDSIIETVEVEVPFVPPALIQELPLLSERIAALIDEVNKANEVTRIRKALEKPKQGYTPKPSSTSKGKPPTASVVGSVDLIQTTIANLDLDAGLNQGSGLNGSNSLGQGERKVLNALAQFPEGCTTAQANMLCGFSRKSSSLGTILGRLRKMGYVHEADGTPGIRITQTGLDAIGGPKPALSGQALVDHWMSHPRMDAASKKVLSALMSQWPEEVSMEYLFNETGFSATSSSVGTALGRLRGLGLCDKNRRRATSEFMEAVHYP